MSLTPTPFDEALRLISSDCEQVRGQILDAVQGTSLFDQPHEYLLKNLVGRIPRPKANDQIMVQAHRALLVELCKGVGVAHGQPFAQRLHCTLGESGRKGRPDCERILLPRLTISLQDSATLLSCTAACKELTIVATSGYHRNGRTLSSRL